MAVNFATPIAHQTNADYIAFDNAVALGRPFRQPLVTAPGPDDFAPGLELFLSAAGDVAQLYAWFNSTVTFVAETQEAPGDRLVLTVDPLVLSATGAVRTLASLQMLERRPKRLTFVNVDRAAVQAALETVLNGAYAAASAAPNAPNTWHPSMRMLVTAGAARPVRLKNYLDTNAPVAATVATLVTDLLSAAPAILPALPVQAGEVVGRAGAYLPLDPLPADPPFGLGAMIQTDRARRITIITENTSGDVLDPTYYLHLFLRRGLLNPAASRIVETLTHTVVDGNLVHPLVTLLPALGGAEVPYARRQVNGAHRYPISDLLAGWHGYPFPPDRRVSLAEWRYTDAGLFEARTAATGEPIDVQFAAAHTNKVTNFWTTYGNVTNQIATRLQIPVELIVALACNESLADLSARSIRLEWLSQNHRNLLRASAVPALALAYDQTIGDRATITAVNHQAEGRTLLTVTLEHASRIGADRRKNRVFLIGDTDRLDISGNNGSEISRTNYEITVQDGSYTGSSPREAQAPNTTRYYSLSAAVPSDAAATAAPIRTRLTRAGRLRRLRVRLRENTLPAGTVCTVMLDGVATGLTVTLAAGATVAESALADTVAGAAGNNITLRVVTPAGAENLLLRDIECSVLYAPATQSTGYILHGYSPANGVPDPWNGAAAVRNGRPLTWDQLSQVMDVLEGARVSPGLVQTLISTAMETMRDLEGRDPGIFGVVGAAARPATASGYLNDWLLIGGHSLLLGAAYLRGLFQRHDNRFDLPVVGSGYNRGNVSTTAGRRWGFGPEDWAYPLNVGRYFNAAVNYFGGPNPPAVAPAVRFMR